MPLAADTDISIFHYAITIRLIFIITAVAAATCLIFSLRYAAAACHTLLPLIVFRHDATRGRFAATAADIATAHIAATLFTPAIDYFDTAATITTLRHCRCHYVTPWFRLFHAVIRLFHFHCAYLPPRRFHALFSVIFADAITGDYAFRRHY